MVACLRVPCGTVGVEVSQDESITLGVKESVKLRGETGRVAGRGRGNVYIVDLEFGVVYSGGNGEVFSRGVVGEKSVSRER